jgi:DNA processing protein
MVESAEDVLAVVEAMRGGAVAEPPTDGYEGTAPGAESVPDDIRNRIVEALGPSPAPVDAIVRDLGLPPAVVLTVLLELELAGKLERQPGNMAALVE